MRRTSRRTSILKTPQERLRLAQGVGEGLPNEAKDVSAVAAALEHFGRFLPARHGSPGGPAFKRELDGALRAFQRSFGLKADGRVLPSGATQKTLNALLAGGLGALVPDGAALRTKGDFEARLKLRGSVGEGADSRREDREMVRLGLGVSGDLPLGAALDEALDDARLGEGIERMNRRFGFSGGRQLAPGSRGEALLASILKRTYGESLPDDAVSGARVSSGDRESIRPRRVQLAQEESERAGSASSSAQPSQTGRYIATDDPALGIWEGGKSFDSWADYIQRAERATGVEIPEYKKRERKGREKDLFLNWHAWHLALKDAGVDDAEHFAYMLTFAWEGGLTPHKEDGEVIAIAGLPTENIDRYTANTGIPKGTKTENLSNAQRVALYRAQFNFADGAFERAGGADALGRIGDKYVAAAIADTFFTRGTDTIEPVMQNSINATLEALPEVAEALSVAQGREADAQARIAADGFFGPQSLMALQVIARSPEAKRFLLDTIANERIAFDGTGILEGDKARYNFYRFQ